MRDEGLARRLVVRRGIDGRCTYDEGAKQELVEKCLTEGHSLAKMARAYEVNANQLHNWIALYRQEHGDKVPTTRLAKSASEPMAFIPIVATAATEVAPVAREIRLDIRLDNGTQADLRGLSRDDVLALLPVLAGLPCSVSTRR